MFIRQIILYWLTISYLTGYNFVYAQDSNECIEVYEIDRKYTNIMWYASRMGFSRTIGKFEKFQGTINLNNCNTAESNIHITIDTNSIVSGVYEIDQQLRSITFFDVENYPEAIFESTGITLTEKDTAEVKGNFTMLGNTHEITLEVRFNKRAIDPIINQMRTGYSIRTSIQRSKWGMDQLLAFVSDDINIAIEAEALRIGLN
jgi:polyisoprenoid-binding protein YceI